MCKNSHTYQRRNVRTDKIQIPSDTTAGSARPCFSHIHVLSKQRKMTRDFGEVRGQKDNPPHHLGSFSSFRSPGWIPRSLLCCSVFALAIPSTPMARVPWRKLYRSLVLFFEGWNWRKGASERPGWVREECRNNPQTRPHVSLWGWEPGAAPEEQWAPGLGGRSRAALYRN